MIITILLCAAALLAASTAVLHVFAGGVRVVRPLLAIDTDPQIKWLSYLMWHLGTVTTLFIAAGFATAAVFPARFDYAWIATIGASSFVAVALFVVINSDVQPGHCPRRAGHLTLDFDRGAFTEDPPEQIHDIKGERDADNDRGQNHPSRKQRLVIGFPTSNCDDVDQGRRPEQDVSEPH